MILMREKYTSSSRDRHGLFFMNKQRICVYGLKKGMVVALEMMYP